MSKVANGKSSHLKRPLLLQVPPLARLSAYYSLSETLKAKKKKLLEFAKIFSANSEIGELHGGSAIGFRFIFKRGEGI